MRPRRPTLIPWLWNWVMSLGGDRSHLKRLTSGPWGTLPGCGHALRTYRTGCPWPPPPGCSPGGRPPATPSGRGPGHWGSLATCGRTACRMSIGYDASGTSSVTLVLPRSVLHLTLAEPPPRCAVKIGRDGTLREVSPGRVSLPSHPEAERIQPVLRRDRSGCPVPPRLPGRPPPTHDATTSGGGLHAPAAE